MRGRADRGFVGVDMKKSSHHSRINSVEFKWPLADIVRIYGGHTFEVAASDLLYSQALSKPHALVVLDDCRDLQVNL